MQLKAEGDAVEAYALISASRSSGTSWAKPDGSARSADAAAAFAAARKRARTAALVLASGADGLDDSSALSPRVKPRKKLYRPSSALQESA